jgi:hypothetical protein
MRVIIVLRDQEGTQWSLPSSMHLPVEPWLNHLPVEPWLNLRQSLHSQFNGVHCEKQGINIKRVTTMRYRVAAICLENFSLNTYVGRSYLLQSFKWHDSIEVSGIYPNRYAIQYNVLELTPRMSDELLLQIQTKLGWTPSYTQEGISPLLLGSPLWNSLPLAVNCQPMLPPVPMHGWLSAVSILQ